MTHPPNPEQLWKIAPEMSERILPRHADGRVDFLQLEPAHLVGPGEKIADAAPADDLTGLRAGAGCRRSTDGASLASAVDGLLEVRNGVILVNPLRILPEATGSDSLQFPGNVVVLGDVKGTSITAGGTVAIRGT